MNKLFFFRVPSNEFSYQKSDHQNNTVRRYPNATLLLNDVNALQTPLRRPCSDAMRFFFFYPVRRGAY